MHFVQRDIPRGTIFAWSGSLSDIPIMFHLCDGARGTPDLRNRFVQGAPAPGAPGTTGGALTHTHTFTSNIHEHITVLGVNNKQGTGFHHSTNAIVATGITDHTDGSPPWHALAFIMYLGCKR